MSTQGEIALHYLGLVGSLTKCIGLLRMIALDTTYLQVSGSGKVDFAQKTGAFKLHLLAQISGSATAGPVVLARPFRTMKGWLNADGNCGLDVGDGRREKNWYRPIAPRQTCPDRLASRGIGHRRLNVPIRNTNGIPTQ